MTSFIDSLLEALRIGTGFLWTAGWAIIMGLVITSWVQVYVSKERIAGLLGEPDLPALAKATAFGAASSGCSFGAAAIAKGLFRKGAHAVNTLAFMFASTNLIVELGLMILILFGWEFLAAEILGGLVLIVIMAVLVRLTLPTDVFEEARGRLAEETRERGDGEDPVCGMEGSAAWTLEVDGRTLRFCSPGCRESFEQERAGRGGWRDTVFSWSGWYRLGNRYRKEWSMIWKDVVAGFLISGFVIVFVPRSVWDALFVEGGSVWAAAENALMGVAVAVISFVGSIGNVPFAVALWTGGVSFAGVIAFIYSDLITVPVLNVYRKYYGWRVMVYILGVFFVTMAASGFLMEQLFAALDIIPSVVEGESATAKDYFSLDYTFWLNLVAIGLSAFLYGVYRRGLGAPGEERDAVCGMRVGPDAPEAAAGGRTYRFCSEGCRRRFTRDPERYLDREARSESA
jgi:uncharacterized membrane protein YraQ (UPF0718 family)